MSHTVSLRLPDDLIARIDRFARMLGNGTSRSKASMILIDEALREEEFAGIEFRNTSIGRQPYLKQTGMAVWEFIMVARRFGMDPERVSKHLQYPVESMKAGLNYYDVYREEIDQALLDNEMGEDRLKRMLPSLRVFEISAQSRERPS